MQLLKTKKRWPWIVGVLVIVFAAGAVFAWLSRDRFFPKSTTPPPTQTTQKKPAPATPSVPTLRFAAMGDMLSHDSVVGNAKTASGYDFTPYFTKVRPLFQDADVTFCNVETLVSGPTYGISGYPAFNAPTEFARDLRGIGCNLLNLANNHMNDKGQAAINATLDVWDGLKPLAHAGANRSVAEQNTVRYFTKNDIKVAFVAFADFSNNTALTDYGVNFYHNDALVTKLLGEARANADVVIVSAHWGTEDSTTVNADQQRAAQRFADLGADVVIGTGPHVLQKVSQLTGSAGQKTLVWYSIGNMLSSQLQTNELTSGVAGFTVQKKDGRVTVEKPTFKSTFMSYDWPATDRATERLSTRTNLMLYPLRDAGQEVAKFGATLDERKAFIAQTLGNEVPVTITD